MDGGYGHRTDINFVSKPVNLRRKHYGAKGLWESDPDQIKGF
jgi:hypothetical protein